MAPPNTGAEAANSGESAEVHTLCVKKDKTRCVCSDLLGTGSGKTRNSITKYISNMSWRLAPGKANLQKHILQPFKWLWDLEALEQSCKYPPYGWQVLGWAVCRTLILFIPRFSCLVFGALQNDSSCTEKPEGVKDKIFQGRSKKHTAKIQS